MTYNLKLDEREFGIVLRTLVNDENYDIIKHAPSKYDNDIINIDFRGMLEYGNAYLVKCCLVDEEKDYKKLNCETHINQSDKKNDWAEDYEICNYGIRKRKISMNEDNRIKQVTTFKNKYGVEFNVGDYVFLPLRFYNYAIWKIIKIEDETNIGRTGRLWLDQGDDSLFNGKKCERHIRGMSIDNPFIKVDKECGVILFDNNEFENRITK